VIFDITRLTGIAGQEFNSPKCRVRSPHITARDSIAIGNYIVAQQEKIAELEKSQTEQQLYIDHALDNSKESLIERIAELEKVLENFLPMDDEGGGWNFQYNAGSEHLGRAVIEALKEQGK
tara:strand:- start:30 stop:392 length:363 start_codon:yes stop_codon:yes gene_type:complete